MNSKLGTFVEIFDLTRNDLLKAWQYACLLTTWFYERNGDKEKVTKYFTLYQKIFHIRRMHRVLQSLIYLPVIRNYIRKLKEEVTFTSIFGLLGAISVTLFFLFDNFAIILMLIGNPYYRAVRRVSYSTLLTGLVWQTFSIAIKLRQSFAAESEIKKELEEMTPIEFLERLAEIDEERKFIAIEFTSVVGDLFPALARTNLPQTLLKTKINKGTVGFFGMVGSISAFVLKIKERQRNKRLQKK